MTIHNFGSTGEAYDACQCDENIKTGDTLVVASEGVVGLAWAWPVAVTENHGHFHTVKDGSSWGDLTDYDGKRVFTTEQIVLALNEAAKLNAARQFDPATQVQE